VSCSPRPNISKTRSWSVSDAHHFRAQAQLYFELARRMSLRVDADYCRVIAERNLSRAADLESDPGAMPRPTSDARSAEHG
jgi:hypothetical protein